MSSLFDKLLGREKKSANQAKERLQFVLIHDRAQIAPGVLESLKNEIIEVISRHIDIEASGVRLEMNQEGREQRLVADIPLAPARKRRS